MRSLTQMGQVTREDRAGQDSEMDLTFKSLGERGRGRRNTECGVVFVKEDHISSIGGWSQGNLRVVR